MTPFRMLRARARVTQCCNNHATSIIIYLCATLLFLVPIYIVYFSLHKMVIDGDQIKCRFP